jgi:hypothetical protein
MKLWSMSASERAGLGGSAIAWEGAAATWNGEAAAWEGEASAESGASVRSASEASAAAAGSETSGEPNGLAVFGLAATVSLGGETVSIN